MDVDLKDLSLAELTDLIGGIQSIESSLRRRRLAAIAEYDRRNGYRQDGATSMSAWMVGMWGYGRDTANEEVRVAHAFEELKELAKTFEDGELSWDQARAVTEFATPETEHHLVDEAKKFSAPQLRRMAQRFKRVSDRTTAEAINDRALKMWWDIPRNMLRLKGQFTAADGAVLEKAIDRIVKQLADDPPAGETFNVNKARADALVQIASAKIAADPDADRATIGVHIDASVLAGGAGLCETESGQALALETARRMACDSRWYIVIDGPGGLPIGIGRIGRNPPAWLAREIRFRDGGCRFPGCNRRGWISIHHIVHWGKGGPTDMDNLLVLCGFHHRLVHEGGWTMEGNANGTVVFIDPRGNRHEQGPRQVPEDMKPRVAALATTPLARETQPAGDPRAAAERYYAATNARRQAGPAP